MAFFENFTHKYNQRKLNDTILIVDGMNTFIRSMAVVKISNDNGIPIGGYAGFLMSIGYAIKLLKPTRCILVFDGKDGSKQRKEIYSEYKANRIEKRTKPRNSYYNTVEFEDKSMRFQMSRLGSYLTCLPVQNIIIDYVEADDVISYIVNKEEFKDSNKYIMSTDQDFYQLINKNTFVYSPTKKIIIDENYINNTYNGLIPKNFIILKTLQGDVSDNIPKIRGTGVKTLNKHLPILFEDKQIQINDIYIYLNNHEVKVKKYKVLQAINEGKDLLELNYKLMQLNEPLISENNKLEINNMLNNPIPKLNKYGFLKYAYVDNLENGIKRIDIWVDEVFNPLTIFVN